MAFCGSLRSSTIFKEGYLTQEKKLKSNLKKWWVLEQNQGAVLSRYKDGTKSMLEKTILVEKVEVDRQKHDNYISVKCGKNIIHLRAENRPQRDKWYEAFLLLLGRAPETSAAGSDGDIAPATRQRLPTDPSHTKPPVRRGRRASVPQSTPSLDSTFATELSAAPLPQPPLSVIQEDANDIDVAKIRQAHQCCVRNHVVACNHEGKNMADLDVVYENVHFVHSEEEHHATIADRKVSLVHNQDVYSLHHDVASLQADNIDDENIYESTIGGGGQQNPEPDNARNDLNPPPRDRVVLPLEDFNIPAEDTLSIKRDSQSSIEDNNATAKPARPPVPLHTGKLLLEKIKKLKEEQRQLHGIEKTIFKVWLVGERVMIKLMEKNDGIWVIGLEEGTVQLRGFIRTGDQLIKINKQVLTSAMYARETIRSTDEDQVTLVLKRIPHGFVCTIKRSSKDDDLGIKLEGNEIVSVDPDGLASSLGDLRPQTTGVSGRMCNWAITEINTQSVDLFASTDDINSVLRRAGTDVALIVQPVDFIQMMRDSLNSEASSPILS